MHFNLLHLCLFLKKLAVILPIFHCDFLTALGIGIALVVVRVRVKNSTVLMQTLYP